MTYLWFGLEAEGLHSDRSVWFLLQNSACLLPWGFAKDFLKSRNKELKRNSCPAHSCALSVFLRSGVPSFSRTWSTFRLSTAPGFGATLLSRPSPLRLSGVSLEIDKFRIRLSHYP